MADMRPEPSMEDILASIKRIIADDNPLPRRSYAPPPLSAVRPVERAPSMPPPPPLPRASFEDKPRDPDRFDDSILELTQPALDPSPSPAAAHLQDQQKPWPPENIPAVSRVVERLRQSEAASAQARAASVAAAAPFVEPAPSPLPAPPLPVSPAPSVSLPLSAVAGGITLDALVRDMLRPMLSEWIDTHMPAIVERLVKQEINGTTDEQG